MDAIHFQYNILCLYHASTYSISLSVLLKLSKCVKLIVKCEHSFENIM